MATKINLLATAAAAIGASAAPVAEAQTPTAQDQQATAKTARRPLWERVPRGDKHHGVGGAYQVGTDGKRVPMPDAPDAPDEPKA